MTDPHDYYNRVKYLSMAAAWAAAFGMDPHEWEVSSLDLAKRDLTLERERDRLASGEIHVDD